MVELLGVQPALVCQQEISCFYIGYLPDDFLPQLLPMDSISPTTTERAGP
jgi:hypothetical protein